LRKSSDTKPCDAEPCETIASPFRVGHKLPIPAPRIASRNGKQTVYNQGISSKVPDC
jgi:hypothetical protein